MNEQNEQDVIEDVNEQQRTEEQQEPHTLSQYEEIEQNVRRAEAAIHELDQTVRQDHAEELGTVNEQDVSYASLPIAKHLADKTWEKYGHILYPVLMRNRWNKLDARSGYKLWMKLTPNADTGVEEWTERKILKESQTFIPHEEISSALNAIFAEQLGIQQKAYEGQAQERNTIFHERLKSAGFGTEGWKITQHPSHKGDTIHWEILTDYREAIKNSYTEKINGTEDGVYLGCVVRNGLGTSVALGVDMFTYRPWCSNGAIARGKDLGTFAISHVGSYERIQDAFETGIIQVFERVKDLVEYYRKATQVKMNQQVVDLIVKQVMPADMYLPPYIEVDEDIRKLRKEKGKDRELTEDQKEYRFAPRGREITVWETFNDFTTGFWKSPTLAFHSTSAYESQLHSALVKSIDHRIATKIQVSS